MDKQIIEYLKTTYPDVITKDQFYRICHISKKTRKYKIRLEDVIAFLEARENNPLAFKAPDNFYRCSAYNPYAINIERVTQNKEILRSFLKNQIADYDDVVSPHKVSEITGYSTKTVALWCENGKLKSFNIFNRIKIPKEYLLDFLTSDDAFLISKKSKKHIDLMNDAIQYINEMCYITNDT